MDARRSRWTRVAAAALAATLAGGLAACSGGDEAKEGAASTTSGPTSTLATTTTLDDAAYADFSTKLVGRLEAAGKDQCKVFELFPELNAGVGTVPASTQQATQAVNLSVQFFEAVADTAGAARSKESATVRAAAARLAASAKAQDYSPDWIRSTAASEALGADFLPAFNAIRDDAQKKCGVATTAAPAAGSGG